MIEEEFEVTYLAKNIPEGVWDSPQKSIVDLYLPANAEHATLRIRKSGDACSITKKQPVAEGDASHQTENTIVLSEEEFADIAQAPGKRVEKTRYFYTEEGVPYEVDVFEGALKGLVLVDVEFENREALEAFSAPDWFLADVTQEDFIAGGRLCGRSYEDIAELLEPFAYVKL